jgi:NADH dehydrogenase [ubiquinone] 1 alpha subcomplex assembly factor 5
MRVFDRALKSLHRDRSKPYFSYLREEVASRIVDRLDDIKAIKHFNRAVDLGSGPGSVLTRALKNSNRVSHIIQVDISSNGFIKGEEGIESIHADEENIVLEPRSMDLVVSGLALHWVNDLPGTLKNIRRSLRPDGVFIGAMLGGNTLQELRSALVLAEEERFGGIRPHISPLANLRDVGSLMNDAGFNLVTLDVDTIECPYPDMFTLISHIQGMGESHATLSRSKSPPSKDLFIAAAAIYKELYGEHGEEGLIPATFQVIYMIGWSPHLSQAKPLERGSATVSLKDIENIEKKE